MGATVMIENSDDKSLRGMVGRVTQLYGDPAHRAAEVELMDGRRILFWYYQLQQAHDS